MNWQNSRNELGNQELTTHYNKRCPYMPSDFIRFWVNSLVLMNGT